jgi:endo-1,4-beta-D-glucanase Y
MVWNCARRGSTCIALASALVTSPALAQSHPFPTNAHYAHGFVPSAATAAAALSSYTSWKSRHLSSDCGNGYYRVDNATGSGSTFSEGQGYGMVLTAYFGDKTQFDGLWSFTQKNFNSSGLMGWHVTCSGFTTSDGGSGSATDGDTDIGFALLVAAAQWGGAYAQTAKSYLASLKSGEFTTCSPSGRNVPNAGDWDHTGTVGGGCTATNTSYWMPGYYRVFQEFTGDSYWGKAADDVVALYNLAANPATGIIVNEVDQNGVAVSGQTYDYNSCRIPWRAVLDYLWYGTPGAQQATTRLTNWVNSIGIQNTVDGYNANGTASAAGHYTGLNVFVGGFTAGAMSASQSLVDTFATYFAGIQDDNGTYYGSSLRTLYLLALSGNQWKPLAPASGADAGATIDGGDGGDGGGLGMGSVTDAAPSEADAGTRTDGGGDATAGQPDSASMVTGTDGSAPEGGAAPTVAGSSSSGCGCRLESSPPTGAAGAAIASVLLLATRRRRLRV